MDWRDNFNMSSYRAVKSFEKVHIIAQDILF